MAAAAGRHADLRRFLQHRHAGRAADRRATVHGSLELIITMPVSKAAFVAGTLLYTAVSGTLSALFLLGFALIAGVEISPPGRWSCAAADRPGDGRHRAVRDELRALAAGGNIIASLIAIVLVIISPVYFTLESAPLLPAVVRLRLTPALCGRRHRRLAWGTCGRLAGACRAGGLRSRHHGTRPVAPALAGNVGCAVRSVGIARA